VSLAHVPSLRPFQERLFGRMGDGTPGEQEHAGSARDLVILDKCNDLAVDGGACLYVLSSGR
jgi:hypothetical protein